MNKKLLNIVKNYNPCRPCDNDKVVKGPTVKPIGMPGPRIGPTPPPKMPRPLRR